MTKKENKPLNVEQALNELEATVTKIQNEDLGLELSLTAFEQGVKLVRDTQQALARAEQKVIKLSEEPADPLSDNPDRD